MTLERGQARECERARALGSQALDGPLSDIELRRLDAHLAACPACDEAIGAMAELTARLRTAPTLAGSVAAVPIRAARRRPGRTALQVAGIAAVVAAFAGLGALVASPSGASPPQAPPRLVVAERTDLSGALRDARLTRLWVDGEPGTQRSPHLHAIFA
jgi:anti-sigma factor RsiW